MFAKKRYAAVASTLLLCLVASRALAADPSAKLDPSGECAKPDYPSRWQTEGDGGNVIVAFLVGADGKVRESKIIESSGSARMDRASAKAGARCRFAPGAKGGQAAPTWTKVRYTWVLE